MCFYKTEINITNNNNEKTTIFSRIKDVQVFFYPRMAVLGKSFRVLKLTETLRRSYTYQKRQPKMSFWQYFAAPVWPFGESRQFLELKKQTPENL